jgi:hypothetical protein
MQNRWGLSLERFPVACAMSLSSGSFAPSPVDLKRSSSKWEPL